MLSKTQRKTAIISLLAVNFIYFLSSTYPVMTSNDGSHLALVSALVEEGTIKINNYVNYTFLTDYNLKDGDYYSDRPPGTAFLSVPFYALGKIFRNLGLDKLLSNYSNISAVFVIFLPNIAGTIAVLLLFRFYIFLNFDFRTSLFSSLLFAFTTYAWFESTRLLSHSVSMITVLYASFLIITLKQFNMDHLKKVIAIAALLAFASITEIQNILFLMPFALYLIFSGKLNIRDIGKRNIFIPLLSAISVFLIIYSVLLIYNYAAFDELTIKSNKYNPAFPEERTFLAALSGNFFAGLDKLFTNFLNNEVIFGWAAGVKNNAPGLFVASPVLVLSSAGFYFFFQSYKHEALFFVLLILIEVVIAAFHKTVITRHVYTILPFCFFPIAFIIRKSFEQRANVKYFFQRYWLLSLVLILSLLSAARVFYIMNSYWTRSLSSPFRFIHEIPSYIVFYGLFFLIYYLFKFLFLAKRNASKNRADQDSPVP